MMSPNAVTSFRNLKLAKQLVENAGQDLKNDRDIRAEDLATLSAVGEFLDAFMAVLGDLGYTDRRAASDTHYDEAP